MGIATRIAVRLMPDPPEIRTLLADFTADRRRRRRGVGRDRGGHRARGDGDDGRPRHAGRRGLRRRRPAARRRRGAARRGGGARRRRDRAHRGDRPDLPGPRRARRAHRGRRRRAGAALEGAASRRSARSPASRPTTTCTTPSCRGRAWSRSCARRYEISERYGLITMNVFHAGDGNLHPLLVFDGREPGVLGAGARRRRRDPPRVHRRRRRAVRRARHRHGEARRSCPCSSRADDLDLQAALRDAFDPDGVANPDKVLPQGSRCGDIAAIPAGAWV